MKEFKIYVFLIVFTILGLNYFYATFLPEIFKTIRFGLLFLMVLAGLYYSDFFKKNENFDLPIKIIIFSMLFSVVMAYLTWDQPLPIGFLILTPYALWSVYYLLKKFKIPVDSIEKITLLFTVIYSLLYFYQFSNPTNVMFNVGNVEDEFVEYRNIIRIVFPSVGIFWLGVYISLTKFEKESNPYLRAFYIIIILLGIIIPTMEAARTHLVPTLLVLLFHFSKRVSIIKIFLVSISILIAILIVPTLDIPVIQGMIEQSESQKENLTTDIRYLAGKHFLTEFSPYTINYIFGNGMGHGRSSYGQHLMFLASQKGFHTSDVGVIGVFVYFGIVYLVGWLILGFKIISYDISKKHLYVKYYFFNILFGFITGSTLYHINYIVPTVFAIYIFQYSIELNKKKKILKKLSDLLKTKEKPLTNNIDHNQSN